MNRTSETRNKSQAYLPVSVRYLTTEGEVTTNSGADDRHLQIIFHMISAMRNTRQCRRLKPRRNEQGSSFSHLCLVCAGNHHHPLVLQLSIRAQVALVLFHSPPAQPSNTRLLRQTAGFSESVTPLCSIFMYFPPTSYTGDSPTIPTRFFLFPPLSLCL